MNDAPGCIRDGCSSTRAAWEALCPEHLAEWKDESKRLGDAIVSAASPMVEDVRRTQRGELTCSVHVVGWSSPDQTPGDYLRAQAKELAAAADRVDAALAKDGS